MIIESSPDRNRSDDYEQYTQMAGVRWSHLKNMRKSPRHYKWHLENERPDSAAFRKGRALHTLLLEPEKFAVEYVLWPNHRRGYDWNAFKVAHEELVILNQPEWDSAHCMAAAVTSDRHARDLIEAGAKERFIQWENPRTGLVCKGRVDVAGSTLVDLKSTSKIEKWLFSKQVHDLSYHGQLVHYAEGLKANGVSLNDEAAMVVVESSPPYDVVCYAVKDHVLEVGANLRNILLSKLKACQEKNEWPGIANGEIVELHLPEFAYLEAENYILNKAAGIE